MFKKYYIHSFKELLYTLGHVEYLVVQNIFYIDRN
jgi:hypothetical protein